MAKKSPAKSASKKKAAPKKKNAATKKTATKPKSAAKSKPAGKKAQTKTSPKKAKTAGSSKTVSRKELVLKKFDSWKPDTFYSPPEDDGYLKGFTAPPLIAKGDKDAKDILARKFDFDFAKVAAKTPPKEAKPAKKAKKVSKKDLILKKFDSWKPDTLFSPPKDDAYLQGFSAPPLIAKDDKQTQDILARKFDFDFEELGKKAAAEKKVAEEKAAAEKAAAEKKAAEEKAAAEKAAAEKKAAEEKAAAEKAAAEKKAAEEKAAAEKAAAEKKAAEEKAAAEKAAAEKKAAEEKAAAEKAAAEKKAAEEKAAAEKAAAEKKAAEEKAAAEKAAAEKKAAEEKAAAEKATAEPIKPKPVAKEVDPMEKTIKYMIAGVVLLVTLVIAASYSNSTKYYIQPSEEGITVLKGNFAPLGEKKIAYLPGVSAPETAKEVYSKKEALPLVFAYHVDRAESILSESTFPNLDRVKSELDAASKFAVTDQLRASLDSRMTDINLLMYLYKADIAASQGNLTDAMNYLEEGALLKLNDAQTRYVEGKIEMVKNLMEGGLSIQPETGKESIQPEAMHEKTEAIQAEKPEPKITVEEAAEEGSEPEAAEEEEADAGVDLTPIEKPHLPTT